METAGPTLAANYFCELQRSFFYFYVSEKLLYCIGGLCCWMPIGGGDLARDANLHKQVYFKEPIELKKKQLRTWIKKLGMVGVCSGTLRVEMRGSRKRVCLSRSLSLRQHLCICSPLY